MQVQNIIALAILATGVHSYTTAQCQDSFGAGDSITTSNACNSAKIHGGCTDCALEYFGDNNTQPYCVSREVLIPTNTWDRFCKDAGAYYSSGS